MTVTNWLRSFTFQARSSFCIWGGLLKSIHLILQWLSWNLGKGQLIELGRYKILGLGEKYFLSDILISTLHERHIYSLAHAQRTDDISYSSFSWLKSYEIGLINTLATEWGRFRLDLIDAGTFLQDREDSLLWTGGGGQIEGSKCQKYLQGFTINKEFGHYKWIGKIHLAVEHAIKNQTFFMVGS